MKEIYPGYSNRPRHLRLPPRRLFHNPHEIRADVAGATVMGALGPTVLRRVVVVEKPTETNDDTEKSDDSMDSGENEQIDSGQGANDTNKNLK